MYIYPNKPEYSNLNFPNTILSVVDNTVQTDNVTAILDPAPRFNIFIPTTKAEGETDTLEHYYPGEVTRFVQNRGMPSYLKNGLENELIYQILSTPASGIGVYTINLADVNARAANVVLMSKIKIERDVPKLDADGNPLYLTPDGQETTIPDGNTPIVRDVLHNKFYTQSIPDISNRLEFDLAMKDLYDEVPDVDGYTTYPVMGFMYKGRSAFGNTNYFRLTKVTSQYNSDIYYNIDFFNGVDNVSLTNNIVITPNGGSAFLVNVVSESDTLSTVTALSSYYIDDYFALYDEILGTNSLTTRDIFALDEYQAVTDDGSLDISAYQAVKFAEGIESTDTFDNMAIALFEGKVIDDITDILRYRINYVVDLNYSEELKLSIEKFCTERFGATCFTALRGGETSFESAITDIETNFRVELLTTRQLAKCQHARSYSVFTNRMHEYPATYYDTLTFVNTCAAAGNPYTPFAGASVRWTGYDELSLITPSNNFELVQSIANAKLNVVRRDNQSGVYMVEQMMNTGQYTSDRTEFNNALLTADIIYDLVDLIHRGNFAFNEAADVQRLQDSISTNIQPQYSPYLVTISIAVYRSATDNKTNIIEINIDFKAISKNAKATITINDVNE